MNKLLKWYYLGMLSNGYVSALKDFVVNRGYQASN